jgi:uncharacterized protein (TIGR03083 family)
MPDAQFFRDVRPQYAKVESALAVLLKSLSANDWERPATKFWTVKDVAAHLLDGHIRQLSLWRDGYYGENPGDISTYEKLLGFLDRLNNNWTQAARRISPAMLIQLLEVTSAEALAFFATLDLHAPAPFPVAWAGESESATWFHLARELTERWHHQQQIRLATGKENALERINTPELYYPVLDTFMQALPHHYRSVAAAPGSRVEIEVSGTVSGTWSIERKEQAWELVGDRRTSPAAKAILPDKIAWRVFTRGITPEEAERAAVVSGDPILGKHVFEMVAVMA